MSEWMKPTEYGLGPVNGCCIDGRPIAQPRQHASKFSPKGYIPKDHPIHKWKKMIKREVQITMNEFALPQMEGPVWMAFHFIMPRAKKPPPGMQRPDWRYMHQIKPDFDNLVKGVKDALSGVLYVDDCQVCAAVVDKMVAADSGIDVVDGPFLTLYWAEILGPRLEPI